LAEVLASPMSRSIAGVLAVVLVIYGLDSLGGANSRGAAAAILLGTVSAFVAATGRLPRRRRTSWWSSRAK
jgi:hypothetical protein